ncbi:MAG: hypothetical protein K0R69_1795 [Clostridia bacterium]|nr:hypothetical protein [Clostridia bacterium]
MESIKAIGLDIGTTTICGMVLDAVTGEVLKKITRQNDALIVSENQWEKLQAVSVVTMIVKDIVEELCHEYKKIACIGVTGQMHGIVYINDMGEAVSPLFSWQDGRGDLEYKEGLSYAGYLSKLTGYSLATGFGAVTHFYNDLNRLVPKTAKQFCTIMDYIVMQLTHTVNPLVHSSNAASIGIFDMESGCFDKKAIELAAMDCSFFPQTTRQAEVIKGHKAAIPVAVAIGDNQASFMGSVKDNTDCLLVNIGTSSQISMFTEHFSKASLSLLRPLTAEEFILVGSPLCGGRAYALLEGFFRAVSGLAGDGPAKPFYDIMADLAQDFLTLENPLVVATQFSGTRSQPDLRGSISNMGTDNFTPKHFTIGVLQGMVNELKELYETMASLLTHKPQMLIGSGNGIRMNKPLQQMIATSFNMPLHIPVCEEEAAYGSSLFSLFAMGFFETLKEAQDLIKYK